jgi:hypothetical protein
MIKRQKYGKTCLIFFSDNCYYLCEINSVVNNKKSLKNKAYEKKYSNF